jgi:hypothetical protein
MTLYVQHFSQLFYLVGMENQYFTLQILAQIAQEESNPIQYLCTPREMILHATFDWERIYKHLLSLQEENLVVIAQADTLQFSITQQGLNKIRTLEEKPGKELQVVFKTEIPAK